VRSFHPEVFVVAPFQHTQLEERLAEEFPDVDWIGFTGHLFQSRPELAEISRIPFATKVAVAPDSKELDKNALLCSAVLGHGVTLGAPHIEARPEGIEEAKGRLARLGLGDQPFWAVCAGDIADKSVKNWTREQWAEFCRELSTRRPLRLLFIGTPEEHEATTVIQKLMGEAGLRTATMTAEPAELRTLTGILHLAEGYIGKDTGPMHIAAALGKPVLTVFGGGHWPRFVPMARIGAALTVHVPCAGCNWECHLSRSHCVKDIPVGAVLEFAEQMMEGSLTGFVTKPIEADPVLNATILRELWQSAQRERLQSTTERANFMQWHDDRMRDIEQLKAQLADSTGQTAMLEAALASWRELERRTAPEQAGEGTAAERLARMVARLEEFGALEGRSAELEARAARLEFENRLAAANYQEMVHSQRRHERFRQTAARKLVDARAQASHLRIENQRLLSDAEESEAWRAKWESEAAEANRLRLALDAKAALCDSLQATQDQEDSRALGELADQNKRTLRRDQELESALALIPDLRDELAQAREELGGLAPARAELEYLRSEMAVIEADRAARLTMIEELAERLGHRDEEYLALRERFDVSEGDRAERLKVIEALAAQLAVSDGDRAERLRVIEGQVSEIAALRGELDASQKDRIDRGGQIETLHRMIASLQMELTELRNLLPYRILKKIRIM